MERPPVAPSPRGLRAITIYKLARGAAEIVLAAALAALLLAGQAWQLSDLDAPWRGHLIGAWIAHLAMLATPGRLWGLVGALLLDAAVAVLEGVSLSRRWWWGPWLVVATTSAALPFEVVALAWHPHAGRIVLLIANLAIVTYLVVPRAARATSAVVARADPARGELREP